MERQLYDALLVLSFGGPEKPEEVMPFLENVLRGRNVSRERMLEVADNYARTGGRSPINDQNRALIAALREELAAHGHTLPVYWGNRNWHPLLPDTVRQMAADGVRRALVFVTSAYSSYSGCRQYREDLDRARAQVGENAPEFDKLRQFFNHPGFIGPLVEHVGEALREAGTGAHLLFTAHSIPVSMSETSRYLPQLEETARLVGNAVGRADYRLVFQSRSGPPQQRWLEPDIADALREIARDGGARDVVVAPIGFISDHMEVKFDLDTQAWAVATELGLRMVRAATAGTHPRFIRMIRELIEERVSGSPFAEGCLENCCPNPHKPAMRSA